MGISLSELDNITIGFILDLIDENNCEINAEDKIIDADTEIIDRFF